MGNSARNLGSLESLEFLFSRAPGLHEWCRGAVMSQWGTQMWVCLQPGAALADPRGFLPTQDILNFDFI